MNDTLANWIINQENCKMMAILIIDVARLVFLESKFCHITPLLRTLHWLSFKYCTVFKVLLITFKAIHGLAPSYISNLISVGKNDSKDNNRPQVFPN